MNKKIISLIMGAVLALQTITPAIAATKDISVEFQDSKLYVNKTAIAHKQNYLHDERLYIPLGDLARGLGMKVDFDGKTMKLSSNGKLDINPDSKAFVAYQRGFELQSRNRIIKDIENEIIKMSNEKIIRNKNNIKIRFEDIKILLDGREIKLSPEPFFHNGDIYTTIDSVSRAFLVTPEKYVAGINFDTNMVLATGAKTEADYIKLVANRDRDLDILNIKLKEMEKKKKVLMDLNMPYMEIKSVTDMEIYLNKYYSRIEKSKDYLDFKIKLKKLNSSSYSLDIDTIKRSGMGWYDLTPGEVQGFVWNIYTAINVFLDDKASIEGIVSDSSYYRTRRVSFQTYMHELKFDFINSGLDMTKKVEIRYIEELLHDNRHSIYKYDNFEIAAKVSGYDIELNIKDKDRLYIDKWDERDRLYFLKDIERIIKREYPQVSIFGRVYNGETFMNFNMESGFYSDEILKDLEDRLNKYYSEIGGYGKDIKLEYTLSEDENGINVTVHANVSKNANYWNDTMKNDILNTVGNGIDRVILSTEKSIIVRIYDEDGYTIDDYAIHRNQVLTPKSRPSGSGNINVLSTDLIELYTDTNDASIYYTLDGTIPTRNSFKYQYGFNLNESRKVKAMAIKEGMTDSQVVEFNFVVVDDINASSGLSNLRISNGDLDPSFTSKTKNYKLNLDEGISEITINARAESGIIKIGEELIKSDEAYILKIDKLKEFTITQEDKGKKPSIYTFTINSKEEKGNVTLKNYKLKGITPVGLFTGNLTSENNVDFRKYEVVLQTKTGKELGKAKPDKDGSFKISFESNTINNIIGYKYDILLNDKSVVGNSSTELIRE